jgi:hypothetical protein
MATKRPGTLKPESINTFDENGDFTEGYGYQPKLWRLMLANEKAVEEIKKTMPPKTDKELRAKIKTVAIAVARALNTAPTLALSAYIDPGVWEEWKSATRRSLKSPSWAAVAAKAKKIEELLARSFRARWKAVEADFNNGTDVAKERADCFLAGDSRTRLRTARRYYTLERATKFANSSTSEIAELCWAWFNPFQLFAHKSGNDMDEVGAQLEQLVGSEYVAMTWGLFENALGYTASTAVFDPEYPPDLEEFYFSDSPNVYPLPDLITEYGDVFEGIVYSYTGESLRVCKSVVEPFLPAERVEAMNEIEQRFLYNASEEGDDPRSWMVNFRCLTSFLIPKYGRTLIEADFLGNVRSARQKKSLQMLKEQLKRNGNGYLKAASAC